MSLLLPLYMAGLLGLLLPWLLHRFSHQQPVKVPFPSMRFLEATKPPVSRQKRLRYRWLLALRSLFLILLCLLFAEPILDRLTATNADKRLHLLALDTSLSMRAGDRWSTAIDATRDYLSALEPGARVRLLTFDQNVVAHTEKDVLASDALTTITTIEPGFSRADYGNVMQRINTIAASSKLPTVVTLFTDAQRSSLPIRGNALSASDVKTLDVVDVSASATNVFLQAHAHTNDEVNARIVVTVRASTMGDSKTAEPLEREVVVSHLDRVLAKDTVSVIPGQQARLVFDRISLPSAANAILRVGLTQADSLVEDNNVTVIVRDSAPIDVASLTLDSASNSRQLADARVYVSTAVELDGNARYVERPGTAAELPADVRHAVVFADILDNDIPDQVVRFAEKGGGVLLVQAPAATIAAPVTTFDAEGIGKVDPVHALGLAQIDWRGVRFYQPKAPVLRSNDAVLLATVSGTPILIERRLRGGLLLILTDTLTGVGSNLPLQPAYVELMRRVVDYLDGSNALPESLIVGEALSLPANVQLLSPEGDALLALADTATPQSIRLSEPGVYNVVGVSGNRSVRVGVDPEETDLRRLTDDEVTAWEQRAGGLAAAEQDTANVSSVADDQAAKTAGSVRILTVLLPLIALLLLAESIFGNRRLSVKRDGS